MPASSQGSFSAANGGPSGFSGQPHAPERTPVNPLQALVAQVAAGDSQLITSSGSSLFTTFELQAPALVKLSDVILGQAVRHRATDIHIEPGRDQGRVRYRVDGVLQHVIDLPSAAHARLVARLKSVAYDSPGQDPDDGFPVVGPESQARTAYLLTTPTPEGELVTIRLVNSSEVPTFESLGFGVPDGALIRELLRRRDGLMVVTGPAGAGTTSFVYAWLNAQSRLSSVSLETRVEKLIPGVVQVKYDASSGKSFAETLQGLLDRSPDVVHVGEIRDLGTARIAVRAAVTGRKVIGTLHSSDAVSGLRRLRDMGIESGRLAESCHAVVSLRLVRKLCEACRRAVDPAAEPPSREGKLAQLLGLLPAFGAVGCKACSGTGYKGQIPLAEVLEVTPDLKSFLASDPSDADLLKVAIKSGMRTFARVGLDLASQGHTTIEEVERVLGLAPLRVETGTAVGPVLVVEAETEVRSLARQVLEGMSLRVLEAETGAAAKQLLDSRAHDFILVVLAAQLPDVRGEELLRYLRNSLLTRSLPVVTVSGSPDPNEEIQLLEAGADDHVAKPIAAERFGVRVRALLRRSGVALS